MKPMRDNPCIGCVAPKRYPGCHAKCIDYIITKAYHNVLVEEDHKKRSLEAYTSDMTRNNMEKSRKRRNGFKGHYWPHS